MCRFVVFNKAGINNYDQPHPAGWLSARCEEHNWTMLAGPIDSSTLCPIGEINKAVDDALRAIDEALSKLPKRE